MLFRSRCFEAICEGVTVVRVSHGIKGEKRIYLMVVIVERKALDVEYRKHGLSVVGSPHQGLIRGSDKTSAQLNSAHCQICIPAVRTDWWNIKEPVLEVPVGKKGICGLGWDGGHPVQGLIRYKTGADGMVYRYGIQPWYTRRVKQT